MPIPKHTSSTTRRPPLSVVPLALLGLSVLGTIAFGIWTVAGSDPGVQKEINWVYDAVILLAGMSCLAQALISSRGRGAWIAFGVGLIFWGLGNTYWTEELANLEYPPYPSWADAGYLAALPCLFVGIALMIKRRIGQFTAASWFDGLIAALAAAAAGTAFLAPALIGLTQGDPSVVITNLAYPLSDLILLAFIAGALVVGGIRGAGSILVVAAGLLVWCGADMLYLYQTGTGTYVGGWADLLWPLGAILIAASAQLSLRGQRLHRYSSSLIPPALSMLVATAILIWDHFERLHQVSVWLAGATILAAMARLAVSFRENTRLTHALHGEAITDALTGLSNRRKLLQDLEHSFNRDHSGSAPTVFAMFDLDGFKAYNDSYGHPAGDALLQRLGANLARSIEQPGTAYRLGGDEFCILADTKSAPTRIVATARAALSESGEGFEIGASGGWLLLPDEAETPSQALGIADERMYAQKSQSTARSASQTQELLMRITRERDPKLGVHVDDVCGRAVQLARAISLPEDELDVVTRAAKLHDIGKIAIPDDILSKPGSLDKIEWTLMRRHTLIGQRILGSTPGLKEVGALVRSSHERWDGDGYPDGLKGDTIPLGARIIFIADAFDAMCANRTYQASVTEREALDELRHCAGTQFDPELVPVFCRIVEEGKPRGDAASNGYDPARSESLLHT